MCLGDVEIKCGDESVFTPWSAVASSDLAQFYQTNTYRQHLNSLRNYDMVGYIHVYTIHIGRASRGINYAIT